METGRTQPGEEETEDLETPGMQGVQEEMNPRDCYNCGKEGHFARDCRGPKKQRREVECIQDGIQGADHFLDVNPELDIPW